MHEKITGEERLAPRKDFVKAFHDYYLSLEFHKSQNL
jgi:hypothetical protein